MSLSTATGPPQLILGRKSIRRLLSRSNPLRHAGWRMDARESARLAGLARTPRLRVIPNLETPLVSGIRRPCMLLPAALVDVPGPLRRAVLLHETEHIRAGDVLTRQAGLAARALLWFSPAVWFALRQSRLAAERACDDRAVRADVSVSDYARYLSELAAAMRPVQRLTTVEVTFGATELTARLESLRDRAKSRRLPTSRPALTVMAGLLLIAATLSFRLPRPRLMFVGKDSESSVSQWRAADSAP